MEYRIGDFVIMKKHHPCGDNRWEILRTGMDYKMRCQGCGRIVMLSFDKFIKGVKRRIEK